MQMSLSLGGSSSCLQRAYAEQGLHPPPGPRALTRSLPARPPLLHSAFRDDVGVPAHQLTRSSVHGPGPLTPGPHKKDAFKAANPLPSSGNLHWGSVLPSAFRAAISTCCHMRCRNGSTHPFVTYRTGTMVIGNCTVINYTHGQRQQYQAAVPGHSTRQHSQPVTSRPAVDTCLPSISYVHNHACTRTMAGDDSPHLPVHAAKGIHPDQT